MPCRVLTEFAWFQAKIKIEIEKICAYNWISLCLVLTFTYGRDIGESSRKVAYHPSLVVPCRVLTEFRWFQAKIKIEIEKLCVYYWISLRLVFTFTYGRDIRESSRKVAYHPSIVVPCRVLTEFSVISSKNQNWNRKSLRLLLNLFAFSLNVYIRTRYRRIKQKSGISSFYSCAMSSFDWI